MLLSLGDFPWIFRGKWNCVHRMQIIESWIAISQVEAVWGSVARELRIVQKEAIEIDGILKFIRWFEDQRLDEFSFGP